MTFLLIILLSMLAIYSFKRLIPLLKFCCKESNRISHQDNTIFLDLRDYSLAHRYPVEGSINIPFAYLKRYYSEIRKSKVFLIGAEIGEIKASMNYLNKKGFEVTGYGVKQNSITHPKWYTCR